MMPKPMTVRAGGIAWYTRDNYGRILEVMEDAEVLPRTFEKWLYKAERGERELAAKGHIVVRAVIDADEFVAWCRARGLNVDAKARGQFAAEVAMRVVKETH